MGAHKIYRVVDNTCDPETLGQCWAGESVQANIDLCEYQSIRPVLLKYLPREGMILESGCGLGRWVFYLRKRGYEVIGIDLAGTAVEMAKAHDATAPITLDDVLHSRFPNQQFAAAISLGVVEHFEEGPQQALAELHRVLRDGGILCISVPVQNLLRRMVTSRLKDLHRNNRMRQGTKFVFEEYRYTVSEFQKYLEAQGFEILEIVADDFLPPKNLGIYTDYRVLRSGEKWELNALGNIINRLMRSISPWVACAGAHWVCRKR